MSTPAPKKGRKPLRISVGGGRVAGKASKKAGKKRKRPAAEVSSPSSSRSSHANGTGATAYVAAAAPVPALFRSIPSGRSVRSTVGDDYNGAAADMGVKRGVEEEEADEYGSLDALAAMGCDGEESDVLLALRSLVRRGAAGLCPPPPATDSSPSVSASRFSPVPFVLRPMLSLALLSTVTPSAVSSSSDATFGAPSFSEAEARARADEANRAASAEASTGLEVELARLRRSNRVRLLQLRGTDDAEGDVAVMETEEYVRGCREAAEAETASSATSWAGGILSDEERRAVMDFFVEGLGLWTRMCVGEEEIEDSLEHFRENAKNERSLNGVRRVRYPRVSLQSIVDYLTSVGVLLPRHGSGIVSSSTSVSYWFSLPSLGTAARLVVKGRARIVAKLRFARYKEMKRSVLEMGTVEVEEGKKRLGSLEGAPPITGMPAAFVVKDLLSRGSVKVKETPAGEFIKLVNL